MYYSIPLQKGRWKIGVPIKAASQILGHASVQIAMNTYSHVLPKYQSEAMNKIADYYEEITQ